MAGADSTQQSIRKVIGALKDSTTVGLAKVNSDYKDLDVAIVKSTNHDEQLAKEKHMQAVFDAVSSTRPRADVAYCINTLARRLAKTHNWAVAIKTLIVFHRALREVDSSFHEELVRFTKRHGHILNLSHFKDDSSPTAWDYSAWVRTYALYLEERLECFRILKYDVETERSRTLELDTLDLLEHLPALQQLMFRLLACQPDGTSSFNSVIRYALTIIAGESTKIYSAISGGTLNLVDKFFEMQRHDALRALEIYRKAVHQAQKLSEFYEICRGLDLGQNQNFVKIEQHSATFISTMEEYVKDAPISATNRNEMDTARLPASMPVLAIEDNKSIDGHEKHVPDSFPCEASTAESVPAPTATPPFLPDLLNLDDGNSATELEEQNALALAIVDNSAISSRSNNHVIDESTGWELALVGAPSSNESLVADSQLAGGFDRLVLDSLYDNAMVRGQNQGGAYHKGQVAPNPFEVAPYPGDPFYASNNVTPPANVQMAAMAQQQAFMAQQQQQAFMAQQQQQQQQQAFMAQGGTNPFGNPFGATEVLPSTYPSHNQYTGFL